MADRAVEDALAFVLRSTRHRPQTRAELAAKLDARAVPASARDAALARAARVGAVDDALFARMWVADRGTGRGYATSRLRSELTRRGVADDVAEEALADVADRDEADVALGLARRRAARLPDALDPRVACRRLVGYLVRRGYEQGLATRVAMRVTGVDRDWD